MKKRREIFLIIAMLAAFSQILQAEPIVRKLSNGLTLIFEEDHATELVAVDVWVKGGSSCETTETNGVSHMIEHMVFGTTATRKGGDIDWEIESLGSSLDAHTSKDWAHFSTTVSTRYFSKALDLLSDALMYPVFDETELEYERLIILDELKRKDADPFAYCKDILAQKLYGTHPYAMPVEGTEKSIKAITRDMLLDYHRRSFTAGNIAIVVVGDISAQQAEEAVSEYFKFAGNTQLKKVSAPEKTAFSEERIVMPYKQSYLAVGFIGPDGASYKDVCATDVIMTYFGQRYTGWMARNLKATDEAADFLTEHSNGLIAFLVASGSASISTNRDALFKKIEEIKVSGITDGELEAAKRYLLGQYAFQNETFGGRANTYGFYSTVSEASFAFNYIDAVRGVTNEDIIKAAQSYLVKDNACAVIVGKEEK